MYVESNGYEFSWNETTGEDGMYMEMPRCIVELGDISIPFEELSNPFSRGVYERMSGTEIKGYNADIRRLPIEINISLKYVLSNFNESIILAQELIDKIVFQKYFNIVYLGQNIKCSIEFPNSTRIELNKIDMTSNETNQKNINLDLKICSNYPQINEKSEIPNSVGISKLVYNSGVFGHNDEKINNPDTKSPDKDKKIIE
jgi:hypothetical protein